MAVTKTADSEQTYLREDRSGEMEVHYTNDGENIYYANFAKERLLPVNSVNSTPVSKKRSFKKLACGCFYLIFIGVGSFLVWVIVKSKQS